MKEAFFIFHFILPAYILLHLFLKLQIRLFYYFFGNQFTLFLARLIIGINHRILQFNNHKKSFKNILRIHYSCDVLHNLFVLLRESKNSIA